MLDDIKLFHAVQFARHRERIFGKMNILLPALHPGQLPVRVPRLVRAGVNKFYISRHQSLAFRAAEILAIAAAGDDPERMILRQTFHRRPAEKILRAEIRVAGHGGDEGFHCAALV